VLLAFGYAVFEEAILTQSLFNPNYLHLRLLDYGYLPSLGTALPWAVFVLTIHVIWSLAVPIGLVEAAFPDRRGMPWLKLPGLIITALLFGAGAVLVSRFSLSQTVFRASSLQIGVAIALILLSVGTAFLAFPKQNEASTSVRREAVNPVLLGILAFAIGSALQLANSVGKAHLPWPATVGLELAVVIAALIVVAWASGGRVWTSVQSWAAAFGGLLCYVWVGYFVDHALHGSGNALAHTVFVVAALAVAGWAAKRALRQSSWQPDDQPAATPEPAAI
jgi:hypothetical protein